MNKLFYFSAIASLSLVLSAMAAEPKETVKAAAKKLGETSYSFSTSSQNAAGGGGGKAFSTSTQGQVADGVMHLTSSFQNNTLEAYSKENRKGAMKTQDGWKTFDEVAQATQGGGKGRGTGFASIGLRNTRFPSVQAAELAEGAKELKEADGVISGDLTETAAKNAMAFGRPGGQGPQIEGAKGSVKFWIKDGVISKYELHLEGKSEFNGNAFEINRTTTIEIKEVGSTKFTVPDEAKSKL